MPKSSNGWRTRTGFTCGGYARTCVRPSGRETSRLSVRERYGLPRRPPVLLRAAIVVVGGSITLTLLWLLMPKTPVGVAIDAILTIVIVSGESSGR